MSRDISTSMSATLLSASSSSSILDLLKKASPVLNSMRTPQTVSEVVNQVRLRHSKARLDPSKYKQLSFSAQLLECLCRLRTPTWWNANISPESITIFKVSGSLTNAVFFVSCPTSPNVCTVLLRIYGSSSGSLISRSRELNVLHVISSQYGIGPRIYGTFENGRLEEYFESTTLTATDIRMPAISRWIGARMAELHSVDIAAIDPTYSRVREEGGRRWEIGVRESVTSWLGLAEDVLALPCISDKIRADIDLLRFKKEWLKYVQWLETADDVNGASRRVFSHNDTQYGNLLRLKYPKSGTNDHHQELVDFEYASPNPATFDIANHFHEWTADYHSPSPHILDPARYPTLEERRNFYMAYLHHQQMFTESSAATQTELAQQAANLDQQVQVWSPASHAMWAIWGIVQAREDAENGVAEPEFAYMDYAQGRMASFRREITDLGL